MRRHIHTPYILITYLIAALLPVLSCSSEDSTAEEHMYRINRSDLGLPIDSLLAEDPYNTVYNRALLSFLNDTRQDDSIRTRCTMLLKHARSTSDKRLADIAATYLYYAWQNSNCTDSLPLLQSDIDRISTEDTVTFIGLLANNIAAINAINTSLDYSAALDHFNKGFRIAKAQKDTVNMAVFLSNIAYIYLIREDRSGLEAAHEAYDLSLRCGQTHIQINAITNLADLLLLCKDYDDALRYTREALNLNDQTAIDSYKSNIYIIRACALQGLGRGKEAREEFYRAQEHLDDAEAEINARYWLELGSWQLSEGDCDGAINSYRRGLGIKGCSPEKKRQILLCLSQAYSQCLSDTDALRCYKLYHKLSDSLSVSQKEKDFNLLRMKYEQVEYQQQLTRKQLTIERNNKTIITIVAALLLITVTAASLWVLYRKQSQMYRQIVEQHRQHLQREEKIREESRARQETGTDDSKERELYARIEDLMTSRSIYRQNDISLDRLAEILESNRSYVSKVINRFSGMNFISYINYKRIEEATKILSDTRDDTPLKKLADDLGFNSISTFYRVFQKEIGCPPSRYREEIRRMKQ